MNRVEEKIEYTPFAVFPADTGFDKRKEGLQEYLAETRTDDTVKYVPHPVFSSYEAYQDHIERTQPFIDKMELEKLEAEQKAKRRSSLKCNLNKLLKFFIIWD